MSVIASNPASTAVRTLAAATVASAATTALSSPPTTTAPIGPPAEHLSDLERAGLPADGEDAEADRPGPFLIAVGPAPATAPSLASDPDPLSLSQLPMALPRFTRRAQNSTAYYTIGHPPRPRTWA
ncbi:MAG: hypothetical protein KF768_04115 [Phycisphaeraceae bacterium]|nr:hypothetical protein [Phycisphaeraceae bacterium]